MNNKQYLSPETYNKMRRDMGNAIISENYDAFLDISTRLAQSLFGHFCEELNPSSNGYLVDQASAPIYVAAIIAAAEATKNAIGAVMPPVFSFRRDRGRYGAGESEQRQIRIVFYGG